MRARLRAIPWWIWALWLAGIAVIAGGSANLPSRLSVEGPLSAACYWHDALVIAVECGEDVPGGLFLKWLYNLPILPFYLSFIVFLTVMGPGEADLFSWLGVIASLWLGLAATLVPLGALAWVGIRAAARGLRAVVRRLRGAG